MTENKNAAAQAAPAPEAAPAPAATENQALVTINDLATVVSFLEDLAKMNRLSQIEIAGVKPSFDRIVAFLQLHQAQANAATNAADPVTQQEETLLDLPAKTEGKGKKKASKKK